MSDPQIAGESGRFVFQKHAAKTLHYDFRLEVGGVLKSWAVPKGPSTDPREKRLAIPTPDHRMDYLHFEGVIPKGQPGAGAVLVWDTGRYENLTLMDDKPVSMEVAIEKGHVKICLYGKKIRGRYAMTRTGNNMWLLVKMRGDEGDTSRDPVKNEPESVISGRTIREIEKTDLSPS